MILGTGWGGARLARDIDPQLYDITVISPRNHMVFTPLLASTCVGTIETRSVTVAIQDIQPALRAPQNFFFAANATSVDIDSKTVECKTEDGLSFYVEYDLLAVSTGSQGSTFGIKGVEEHTFPLRDASHSQAIRSQLIKNWLLANIPGRDPAERDRLLHIIVVGGGPTGVEFAGELAAFVNRDARSIDADRARDTRITLIEANELLGSFDSRLREYAARKLVNAGVHLMRGVVKEVKAGELELHGATKIKFGLCVWSTGVGPTEFTLSLPFAKTSKGRLAVDECLRVIAPPEETVASPKGGGSGGTLGEKHEEPKHMADISIASAGTTEHIPGSLGGRVIENVYALGDCCANEQNPLPALAQVAEQQGKYLAKELNMKARKQKPRPGGSEECLTGPFLYKSLGSMASVGGTSAVIELHKGQKASYSWAGFTSWLAWRSAYLTRLGTWKARLFVMTNWTMTLIFGRDVSRW